ncbi:MAG: general secretion pathway protein B [Oleiphilaceae bacterium]|jgi:general secretion pathway protein B
MSYILEALKRSEQERHQGELNHTTIDMIMMPSKQVRHQWWPYLLIVILAINILVYLYFQFAEDSVYVESGDKVAQKSEIALQEDNVSSKSSVYDQEQKIVNQQDKQNQPLFNKESIDSQLTSEKLLPKHLSQTPTLTKRFDISAKPESQANTPLNSYQSKKKSYTDEGFEIIKPKATTSSLLPQNSVLPQTQENSLNYEDEYQVRSQQLSLESAHVKQTLVQQAPVEQVKLENFEDTYHLNDLDLSFKKRIPDISFNSHIYSTNPADRRVMINDLYLREGQSFSGITIETIGEFYILLSKNSQRFKIPVLRDWFTP